MVGEGERKYGPPSAERKRVVNKYCSQRQQNTARKRARARAAPEAGKANTGEGGGSIYNTVAGGQDCVSTGINVASNSACDDERGLVFGRG